MDNLIDDKWCLKNIARYQSGIIQTTTYCLSNNLILPFLTLFYSSVDVMAWLNIDNENVERTDFIKWCDKYFVPILSVPCAGEDLYGARCGILHNASSESARSRKGKAEEIMYVVSKKVPSHLSPNNEICLSVWEIYGNFTIALHEFYNDYESMDILPDYFTSKARKILTDIHVTGVDH